MLNKIVNVTDSALVLNLKSLVSQERTFLTNILWHLKEVDDRKIHLAVGYSSLFEYATQELGYNESEAYRRISAMRVLRENPEIEAKIDSGTLKLTQVAMAQEYFRAENKKGDPVSQEKKLEIFNEIETKSTRETERYFSTLAPELVTKDRVRVLDDEQVEIKFVANQKLLEKLKKFKELDGHVQADPNYAELFERLVDLALKQKDPEKRSKTQGSSTQARTSKFSAQKNPRFISARVKREVIARDSGSCTYQDPLSKRVCGSSYQIEVDHVIPIALGGLSTKDNLRVLCRNHNQYEALKILGEEKMRRYHGFKRI